MENIILPLFLAAAMLCAFIFLYNQGYMVSKSISAVTFIGSAKGNGATFSSCSGYIKRVIHFKEDGSYTFALDTELSKGDVSAELIDTGNQKIMQLNHINRCACVTVEKQKKYYFVIYFKSATGRYEKQKKYYFVIYFKSATGRYTITREKTIIS